MTVQEPLRDQVGRALYEEPGRDLDWYSLSEKRREPWRLDADRIIPIVIQYLKTTSPLKIHANNEAGDGS